MNQIFLNKLYRLPEMKNLITNFYLLGEQSMGKDLYKKDCHYYSYYNTCQQIEEQIKLFCL